MRKFQFVILLLLSVKETMRSATSFQSVRKIAVFIATLAVLPAVMLCSVTSSAAATDGDSKVPKKAEAAFPNLETLKPLQTRDKVVVIDAVTPRAATTGDASNTLHTAEEITAEESNVVADEIAIMKSDFKPRNGAVDMVLLPPPPGRFTL